MAETIKVGIADMNVCKPPELITTIGLGSCVGIAIRDKHSKIGGLVHVMLPNSKEVKSSGNLAKFADTGIPELVKRLEKMGALRSRMVAKIAGGATMFAFQSKSELTGVGDRNVAATKQALKALNIPILAEDCGANYGRTVTFNPETGDYEVKAVGKPPKVI
ncbi:MAG: chemotaxis protein CheD [Lachnospiraceae bacterium]|nr:chemotaxis protein CheD [Lachnospiraceae bacterium]